MSDDEYNKKLESLQRYIPFLVNMMTELKAKGNREAQLTKIQSLHDIITDTRKKLKLETLRRCEEVLTNIYFKVNPQLRVTKGGVKPESPKTLPGIESPRSTPQSPSPSRDILPTKPVNIPTEKIDGQLSGTSRASPQKSGPKIEVYSNVVINSPSLLKSPTITARTPDMSKPPISLDDLKTLEDDVQQKITDAAFVNKSVDELQEVKKQLQLQLRVDQVTATMSPEKVTPELINTTVRNTPTLSKIPSFSESRAKLNELSKSAKNTSSSSKESKTNDKTAKEATTTKSPKKPPKEAVDIFGNLLASIDDKLVEQKKKKKSDRRPSLCKEDSCSTTSLSSDKSDNKETDSKTEKKSRDKEGETKKHRRPSHEKHRDKEKDVSKEKVKHDSKTKSKSDSKDKVTDENKKSDPDRKDSKDSNSDSAKPKDKQEQPETTDAKVTPDVSTNAAEPQEATKPKEDVPSAPKSSSTTEAPVDAKADDTPKPAPTYKRLADKYNPKPKQKSIDVDAPEVDKAVSDSIEKLMKVSPVKALAPTFTPPPEQNKPVQLPDILQKIFSKPLLGDIIPKSINDPIGPLAKNHNSVQLMTKPGAIQQPEPPVLSPPHKPQFQPPPNFLSPRGPDNPLAPEMIRRPAVLPAPSPSHGLLPPPSSTHGILPTPPIPPNLPSAFMDHGLNMGFGTPRVDFDAPGTPMPDFGSPRVDFEPPNFMRNEQFNLNQRFIPPMPEHQMRGFDPRNRGYFNPQPEMNNFNQYDLNQGPMPFYGNNQMNQVNMYDHPSHYMSEQAFYQERSRWGRDRRPGDPRNYREYKEMKERQQKEFREKQKDIKDPRLAAREANGENSRDPRFSRDDLGSKEVLVRDPRLSRTREKSVERIRDVQEFRQNDSGERARNRDQRPWNRSGDRFTDSPIRDSRSRVRESRIESSKFDKMYSRTNASRSPPRSQERDDKTEDEESFVSPLDSLYNAGEKGKTGRGYGVQKFRIPKKAAPVVEDVKRKSDKKEELKRASKKRVIELSDSDDSDGNADDGSVPDNSDGETVEGESSEKEIKSSIDKEETDIDTSRIKVVIKSTDEIKTTVWDAGSSVEVDFVSEYDRELKTTTEETAPRVEEPSSSQDVNEKASSDKEKEPEDESTFKKPAEPLEADSSKAEMPQEKNKKEEPSEQNILAHFFEHLLKSRNKKDKKSALFSLIETFSDSFDDREIQKIRKIIKVNENIEETSDDENDAPKSQVSSKAQEEQPIVGSTTEEGHKEEPSAVIDDVAGETQVNEVSTKSTDESELQQNSVEEIKSDDSQKILDLDEHSSLEPVMVSVGERIKNRKRNSASSKPKKKCKSELDLLHEDIQDMFIRDGVLTATGKRMCRILKDDPNVLATSTTPPPVTTPVTTTPSTTPTVEEPIKTPKKRGRKPRLKVNVQEVAQSSMKPMRVVIKKIPDNILSTNTSPTRQLRSRSKQIGFAETDEETLEVSYDDTSLASSIDAGSDKSDLDGEIADDSEEDKTSQTNEGVPKVRNRRRKGHKWASGIIPKVKKKKSLQSKSKENSPERTVSPVSEVASLTEFDVDKLVEADKDYYYDYVNKRKLNCKLCKYTGHLIAGHYLKEHPQSEVLSSRFPPNVAVEAIKDFAENGKVLESIVKYKLSTKYHYCCRMCGYDNFVTPIFFYEHVTTHTGEYRHRCGICEYFAVTGKTMSGHFATAHPDEERKSIKKTYTLAIVFGYLCGECNFVQLKQKSVEDHFNIFHSGQKTVVYKINMSTIVDAQLVETNAEANDGLATETEPQDKPVEEVKKRKKPGPKSKTLASKTAEPENTEAPKRKKPGPKSKTQKLAEEPSTDDEPLKPAAAPPENAPAKKRRRSLEKLISEDSGDDLDTIITLSSRTSRAAKEKATAKLKTLMENNEGTSAKRKSDTESPKKDNKLVEADKNVQTSEAENVNSKETELLEGEAHSKDVSEKKPQISHVQEMVPPATNKGPLKSGDKDLNVFTCKSDIIQEDAKKIEEDRLRQMDELNKTIVSRALKLDFINKLSDRLNSEQEQSNEEPTNTQVRVKEEPKDDKVTQDSSLADMPLLEKQVYNTITTTPPITKISQSSVVSKKPAFEEELSVQQSNVNFRQNKPNSLFSNMIEKLQGKVNEAAVQQETTSTSTLPSIEATASNDSQTSSSSISDVFISIGDLIRATKSDSEIIYSCHANNCYVATKDKMVFQLHCKFGHKDLNINSSLCEKCGVVIEITPDTTLLENLYDHLMFAHSEFISKLSSLRMRRLSGDKLSIKKEKEEALLMDAKTKAHGPEPPLVAASAKLQDFEAEIQQHVLQCSTTREGEAPTQTNPPSSITTPEQTASEGTLELAEDNPFSFKIASVMSLAEANEIQNVKTSPVKTKAAAAKPPPLPPLKHVPPLTLIAPKQPTAAQPLVVKEAKLTTAELGRPKKAPKALQKFIECPSDLYKCPHFYCMFSTKVRTLLMCHLKAHKCDSATMVPCVYCDMKTPWEHVPMHIDIRHASSKFSCYYCLYRAILKEYVCIHQELAHPDNEFVIVSLPAHKASKKFSIADSKLDYKALCEPFRCYCNDEEGGEPVAHEYLFESEFVNHMRSRHVSKYVVCGYPKCGQLIATAFATNHWATHHGVCTYQCGFCKTSSKDVTRMYTHFSQMHPNMELDILVRKSSTGPMHREQSILSTDNELRFSDEAFRRLTHIIKIPSVFLTTLGKSTHRSIKVICPTTTAGTADEANSTSRIENSTPGISQGAPLVLKPVSTLNNATPTQNQLLLANPNLKLIVASTSGTSEKLYLVPASVVSPPKGTLVTTVAPINKVTAQTSTTSESLLKIAENQPHEPVRIGDVTLYPPDASAVVQPTLRTPSSAFFGMSPQLTSTMSLVVTQSHSAQPLFTSAKMKPSEEAFKSKITAKIKSITTLSRVSSKILEEENVSDVPIQEEIASENDSTVMSEEDILQSAIQSILNDNSNSSNTRLESNDTPSDIPPLQPPAGDLSNVILDPPPLVLLASNSDDSSHIPTPPELVTSLEHVEITGDVLDEEDPLTLETNEESNSADDCDPLSEDPLTITPSLTSDLSSGDPLGLDDAAAIKDPLEMNLDLGEQPVAQIIEDGQAPLKIANMQRSASMVSNSDDESDSSTSEKKKRGLIGYQLYRCAACNLSFSNVKPFRSHMSTSLSCKKSGVKGLQCVHCEKVMKTPQRLADHIMTHGVQRFACSLCNEKFTTVGITKLHMKNRHSVHQTNLVPLRADRADLETDEFVMKPCQANSSTTKDKEAASDSPKLAVEDCTFTPDQIETIPIRQIFNTNVKCGLCNYQTKVRVNILRHLQMHLDEKAVPDTAPVNPVPCLEKNEKMFDKMINLAASSVTTSSGRMGGGVKDKEKEEEKHPEFIPTHRRFVCCAQGCSYLCPEEANLKHHLMALHSDESNFTCAHCKIKIEPTDIENVIKHFKLHGLHLYKCQYCSFVHNLKHKVEKHISDLHLDATVKVVTVRYMESEPQEFKAQEETPNVQSQIAPSKFKPWSCCMCKAKYYTKEDIQSHIIKKHNVDTQYKCTLCSFKNDQEETFRDHFNEKHPSHEFDIIFVYQKIEEEPPKEDVSTPFDTTPLWQRDKPRVRHIRGILFDESSPQPTKSPKKTKTYGTPSPKVTGGASTSKVIASSTNTYSKATPTSSTNTISKATPTSSTNTIPKATPTLLTNITSKATPTPSTNTTPKVTPSTSTSSTPNAETVSKNLFDCIEAVVRGTAEILQNKPEFSGSTPVEDAATSSAASKEDGAAVTDENDYSVKNEVVDDTVDIGNDDVVVVSQSPNIIVIESDESDAEMKPKAGEITSQDDDTPKTKDKDSKTNPVAKNRALKRSSTTDLLHEAVKMAKIEEIDDDDFVMAVNCSKENLIKLYGSFGTPHNKQWKCPKCQQFKSKRVADFMFHLYKDFNTYRYQCRICQDLSITYKYMQDHVKLHPGRTEDIIEPLPRAIKLETWVHMVIREQSLLILKNAPLFKKRPLTSATDIMCYFCNERFMSMPECCEHMLYHWVMMPYQCQHCPNEFYTVYDLKHHHKTEHPGAKLCEEPKGPTLSKAIQCIENPKKRPSKPPQNVVTNKKPRIEDKRKEVILSGVVKNTYGGKKSPKATPSSNLDCSDVINIDDDEDDLVIVSKTDDGVPNEDDVFACQLCVYMASSDVIMLKHLQEKHGVRGNKFHVLSRKAAENDTAPKMACNICDEVFSELKLRQHFLENHLEGHTFAPYRYKCGLCNCKYLSPTRIKMHFSRVHGATTKLLYECVVSARKNIVERKRTKYKKMSCILCAYSVVCSNTVAIRAHVKGHLKPLLCNHCKIRFRYHSELVTHTLKEHPGRETSYTTLDDIMKEFTETIKLISSRAIPMPDDTENDAAAGDSSSYKNVARKSTSTRFAPSKVNDEVKGEFSYYGIPREEFDLSNIITTFELDELEYTTTAEQMMKMFNMDTYVDLSDCVVDIMPLDSS